MRGTENGWMNFDISIRWSLLISSHPNVKFIARHQLHINYSKWRVTTLSIYLIKNNKTNECPIEASLSSSECEQRDRAHAPTSSLPDLQDLLYNISSVKIHRLLVHSARLLRTYRNTIDTRFPILLFWRLFVFFKTLTDINVLQGIFKI